MGGKLHALAVLLEFQIFLFEVFKIGPFLFQKQVRIIGYGSRGKAQGLDMVHGHEAVNGGCHVCPVQEGISPGDHNLLDGGGIFHMCHRGPDIFQRGIVFIPGFFMLPETKPTIDGATHIEQENYPVLVHLLQQTFMELPGYLAE